MRETLSFVTILVSMGRTQHPELEKYLSEYNDLTARLYRGTSPNVELDQNRLRELVAKIDSLRNPQPASE